MCSMIALGIQLVILYCQFMFYMYTDWPFNITSIHTHVKPEALQDVF